MNTNSRPSELYGMHPPKGRRPPARHGPPLNPTLSSERTVSYVVWMLQENPTPKEINELQRLGPPMDRRIYRSHAIFPTPGFEDQAITVLGVVWHEARTRARHQLRKLGYSVKDCEEIPVLRPNHWLLVPCVRNLYERAQATLQLDPP